MLEAKDKMIRSVKQAFADDPDGPKLQAAFFNIFDSLIKKKEANNNGKMLERLLEEHAGILSQLCTIEHEGQLLLHAALTHSASLDVICRLVDADNSDDSKLSLLYRSRTNQHMTPLLLALVQEDVSADIITQIMHADASRQSWTMRDASLSGGRCPLHAAAARGLADICLTLIEENAAIASQPDATGRLPLHYAAASGSTETLQACLAPCLEALWTKDCHGALPLHEASSVPAMEVLMAADVERQSWIVRTNTNLTPLHRLIQLPFAGHVSLDLLQQLIHADDTMLEEMEQHTGLAPFHMALQKPVVEMVQTIISVSSFHALIVRCKKWGNLPIHYAVTKGLEIARLVVDADPTLVDARNSNPGNTPLASLVSMPDANVATVKYLLDLNPMVASIPDDLGYLPLHVALLAGGNQQVVQMLLEADPSAVYSAQYQGALPMHIAAGKATSLDVLEMLLAKDPTRKTLLTPTRDDCLPIHEMFVGHFVGRHAQSGITEGPAQNVVEFFVHGDTERTSLIARDMHGNTPLHYGARYQGGSLEIGLACARVLVEAKPEAAFIPDVDGNLPIHIAANQKHPIAKMIEMLLAADPSRASLSTKNKDGHIPLALARERDTPESILRLLRVGTGPFVEDETEQTKQLWHSVERLLLQHATTMDQLDSVVCREDLCRLAMYRNHFGLSLLHVAAAHSNIDILRVILPMNSSMLLVQEDTHGELPLHAAAMSSGGSSDVLEYLVESDETKKSLCIPDVHGRLALHDVMKNGADPRKASCLLKNDSTKTSLFVADATGNLPIHYHRGGLVQKAVPILIESDPSKELIRTANHLGELPLHSHARNPEIAMFLILADGPNKPTLLAANAVGDLAIHAMVSSFDMTPNAVETYLSHAPAAISMVGDAAELPLHRAARLAPLAVVETLVKAAPELIGAQNADGNTVLHLAAIREARSIETEKSSASFLELILNHYPEGCRVPNRAGQYPVHCVVDLAATASTLPALERLWKAGSPMTDTKGEHTIHYLARRATNSRLPERFLSKILERLQQIDPDVLGLKNRYELTAEQILQERSTEKPLLNLFQKKS